jgi:hypothetical protein
VGLEQVTDLVGVGGADVGEQGEGLLPAGQGRIGSAGVAQGMAEDDQGPGLAEAVAGPTVDSQRLVSVPDGLVVLVLGKVRCCHDGVGLAFQDPVASLAGEGQGASAVIYGLGGLAAVQADGGQPEEGLGLEVAGVGLARQVEGLLVVLDGPPMVASAQMNAPKRVERIGMSPRVAHFMGQSHGGLRQVHCRDGLAGVSLDRGKDVQVVGFVVAVTDLPVQGKGRGEMGLGVIEPPQVAAGLAEVVEGEGFAVPQSKLSVQRHGLS